MNSAAMAEIEAAQSPDQQTDLIDNAIVAAAKDFQEEARQARQVAEREREAAAERVRQAEARLRDERQRSDAQIEGVKRAAEEAARAEAARRDEAAKNEAARTAQDHEAELAQTRNQLTGELRAREAELADERKSGARRARRQRLAWSTVIPLALFVLAALVVGFDHAWEYVVAAAVCLGLLAAVDQLLPHPG